MERPERSLTLDGTEYHVMFTGVNRHAQRSRHDYQKEAAFYAALMGWKIRGDHGKQAVLDTPPPEPAAAGDPNAAAGGGRGGGRGPAPARQTVVDSFCWGIEPWDTKKVEAELKSRGLNPVADHRGKDSSRST